MHRPHQEMKINDSCFRWSRVVSPGLSTTWAAVLALRLTWFFLLGNNSQHFWSRSLEDGWHPQAPWCRRNLGWIPSQWHHHLVRECPNRSELSSIQSLHSSSMPRMLDGLFALYRIWRLLRWWKNSGGQTWIDRSQLIACLINYLFIETLFKPAAFLSLSHKGFKDPSSSKILNALQGLGLWS